MPKLTNAQISSFNSPIMTELFSDPQRTFPVEDAFRIAAVIQQVQPQLKAYQDTIKTIIEKHLGVIDPNGSVTYPSPTNQQKSSEEIDVLNKVDIEYQFKTLKPNDEWPKLTLAEATVLRPLMNNLTKVKG